jgi:hypothetical protein
MKNIPNKAILPQLVLIGDFLSFLRQSFKKRNKKPATHGGLYRSLRTIPVSQNSLVRNEIPLRLHCGSSSLL